MELENKNNSKQPTYENEVRNLSDEQDDQNMGDYVVPQPLNNTNHNTEPYQNLETTYNTKRQNSLFCFATDRKNIIIVILATLLVASIAITVFLVLQDGKDGVGQPNPETNGIAEKWTLWGSWGRCSCWNGTTTQQRQRFCISTMENQELYCPGPNIETQNCLSPIPCFQDGWTDWSSWGQCSCWNGTTTRQRFRFCSSMNTKQQEFDCTGSDIETQNCLSSVTCFASNENGWSEWSSWGQCSCWNGTTTQQRSRLCTSSKEHCPGQDKEIKNCSISVPCPVYNKKYDVWNRCESSPCTNGATCVDVNVDTFICV